MKSKVFITSIIFIVLFLFPSENTYAAKCGTAIDAGFPCAYIDSSGSNCSMSTWAGCYPDQSLTLLAICLVKSTSYNDIKHTGGGSDTVCASFRECQEKHCPNDNADLAEGDVCYVSEKGKGSSPLENWDDVLRTSGKWDKSSDSCIQCNGMLESGTCGDQLGIYWIDASEIEDGEAIDPNCKKKFGTGRDKCDQACGASPVCDEKDPSYSDVGGTCDDGSGNPCVWVSAAVGITLTVSADSTTISAGGSSLVTFRVTDADGIPIEGASVNSIGFDDASDTSNATLSYVGSCITDTNGACTTSFTTTTDAVGSYTIKANNATFENETSLRAAITITVKSDWVCKSGTAFDCLHSDENNKDCLSDLNGTPCGLGGMYSCSSNCDDPVHQDSSEDGFASCGPSGINFAADSAEEACGCDCTVVGPPPCTPIETCNGWTDCGSPSPGQKENVCTWTNCGGGSRTTTQACCLEDADCTSPPLDYCKVATESCVECLQDSHCGTTDRCFADMCVPCKTEGEEVNDPGVCCAGLDWWDMDFDGKKECTSKCNPNIGFFCNTLRSSVDNIVQGGERMIGYILGIIGSVALLLIIISGVMYMTAAGIEEKITSAKKILTGAVIGLAISLLAFSLLQVLMSILNM